MESRRARADLDETALGFYFMSSSSSKAGAAAGVERADTSSSTSSPSEADDSLVKSQRRAAIESLFMRTPAAAACSDADEVGCDASAADDGADPACAAAPLVLNSVHSPPLCAHADELMQARAALAAQVKSARATRKWVTSGGSVARLVAGAEAEAAVAALEEAQRSLAHDQLVGRRRG